MEERGDHRRRLSRSSTSPHWNYYTNQYFHEERNLENWDHTIEEEEEEMDEGGEEERGRGRRGGYVNPRYLREQYLAQQRTQNEYHRRVRQDQFERSRVFSDFHAEEEDTNEMKRREAREAFRDLPEEYNENKTGAVAVLSRNARVIPVDVRGIIETMGKPCGKYILDCDMPGVGIENIVFKTLECTNRPGVAFFIEVVSSTREENENGEREKEEEEVKEKEKENIVRKMLRISKKKDPNVLEPQRKEDVFPKVKSYRMERGTHRKYVQRKFYIPKSYALSSAKYKDGVATFEFTLCEEGQQIMHRQTFEGA